MSTEADYMDIQGYDCKIPDGYSRINEGLLKGRTGLTNDVQGLPQDSSTNSTG